MGSFVTQSEMKYGHDLPVVVDMIDYTISADSQSPEVFTAFQLCRLTRPGLVFQF